MAPNIESRIKGGVENDPRLVEDVLTRGVAEIITEQGIRERLALGKPLKVKFGIDPTMPSAHIGHAVPLHILRRFQMMGHKAVLIIGDYTAMIGDPTGRHSARKALSAEEVKKNAEGYCDQAFRILDKEKTEVHFQSEWYDTFTLEKLIRLMAKVTYGQLMAHETFTKRVAEGKPLGFQEMLYPVVQGFDSVKVWADIELGGADQRFNFVLTRDLQKSYGQQPEEVILMKYLPGIDGQEKMSKSLGNTIDILDPADSMFAKVMSIPDTLMPVYFELATDLPLDQIKSFLEDLKEGKVHPMDLKKLLARSITSLYHSKEEVDEAEKKFKKEVQERGLPEVVPEITIKGREIDMIAALIEGGLVKSKSEVRRLIDQKGIKIDGQTVTGSKVAVDGKKEVLVSIGNRRYLRVKLES